MQAVATWAAPAHAALRTPCSPGCAGRKTSRRWPGSRRRIADEARRAQRFSIGLGSGAALPLRPGHPALDMAGFLGGARTRVIRERRAAGAPGWQTAALRGHRNSAEPAGGPCLGGTCMPDLRDRFSQQDRPSNGSRLLRDQRTRPIIPKRIASRRRPTMPSGESAACATHAHELWHCVVRQGWRKDHAMIIDD
jgi:hypothetical protein